MAISISKVATYNELDRIISEFEVDSCPGRGRTLAYIGAELDGCGLKR